MHISLLASSQRTDQFPVKFLKFHDGTFSCADGALGNGAENQHKAGNGNPTACAFALLGGVLPSMVCTVFFFFPFLERRGKNREQKEHLSTLCSYILSSNYPFLYTSCTHDVKFLRFLNDVVNALPQTLPSYFLYFFSFSPKLKAFPAHWGDR